MTTTQNLSAYMGDTKTINLTVKDSAGSAVDITGATVWMTIKNKVGDSDADALVQKEVTSHADPTEGETQIVITSDDTQELRAGTFKYDIQIKLASGVVSTLFFGDYQLIQGCTQVN